MLSFYRKIRPSARPFSKVILHRFDLILSPSEKYAWVSELTRVWSGLWFAGWRRECELAILGWVKMPKRTLKPLSPGRKASETTLPLREILKLQPDWHSHSRWVSLKYSDLHFGCDVLSFAHLDNVKTSSPQSLNVCLNVPSSSFFPASHRLVSIIAIFYQIKLNTSWDTASKTAWPSRPEPEPEPEPDPKHI